MECTSRQIKDLEDIEVQCEDFGKRQERFELSCTNAYLTAYEQTLTKDQAEYWVQRLPLALKYEQFYKRPNVNKIIASNQDTGIKQSVDQKGKMVVKRNSHITV